MPPAALSTFKPVIMTSTQSAADEVADLFARAFNLFGHCHTGYNSSTYMNDKDIDKLGNIKFYTMTYYYYSDFLETHIANFMEYYRERFPSATVLPKMHILEEHVVPWIRRWRLASGLMGEQGAESIHAHIMKLERVHQGVASDLDRLKYIFKEQTLESAPSLTCLRPPLNKRGPYTKQPSKKIKLSSDHH